MNKLKRRSRTLLLPYILWNIIGCALALVKAKWLGFPSYGILENNVVSLPRLLEGFVDYANGYPYAFAFWFIRNLIVFVILSPLAYFLARNKWIFAIFIISLCLTDSYVYGFEYFTAGAFYAFHHRGIKSVSSWLLIIGGATIWIGGELTIMLLHINHAIATITLLCSVSACTFLFKSIKCTASVWQIKFMQLLVKSTFFIYAIHQFFCTVTRNLYSSIFGVKTFTGVFLTYILSFLTLTSISFIIWLLMRRFSPHLTNILSGGR